MKITATGIKTGGISLELSPLTIAFGDNGKGKTAIADAFRLALLGYHPTLGKRPGEILKLANGKTLEVAIPGDRWELGTISRTWTKKGAGGSFEASESAIEFDKAVKFSPIELDFDSFLQAKATARREILEAALPDPDPTEILREIKLKLTEEGLEDEFEETPKDFVALTKALGEKGREWKQEVARLTGAIQELEIQIAEQTDPATDVEESMPVLQKRRDEILAEQGKQAAKVAELAERLKKAVPKPDHPKPSEAEIERAEEAVLAAREAEKRHAKIREEIRALRSGPEPEIVTDLRAEVRELQDEIREIENDRNILLSKIADLEAAREKLKGVCECPTCGATGEALHEGVARVIDEPIESNKENVAALSKKIEIRNEAIEKLNDKVRERVLAEEEAVDAEVRALEASIDPEDEIPFADPNRLKGLALQWERFEDREPVSDAERDECEQRGIALAQNLAAVDEKIASIQEVDRIKESNARRHGDLTISKKSLKDAKENVKAIKDVGDWSKGRSLEVTAERLRPFLDPANSILSGVVEGSLAIEGTEIGLQQGEEFRPIEVLSGAESTAVAAAIQVALASVGEVGIVIVDELSRLTWGRRESLVSNLLAAAKSGLIKNALVLDHDEDFAAAIQVALASVGEVAIFRVE